MFILKKGHQPRVYVPLRALFMPPTLKKWGGILVSACPYVCMYVCMYVRTYVFMFEISS